MRGIGKSREDPADRIIRQGIAITAITLPVLSFGDSTFLDSPIAWTQVATLLAFYCAYRKIARPVPKWAKDGRPEVPERLRVVRRTLPSGRMRVKKTWCRLDDNQSRVAEVAKGCGSGMDAASKRPGETVPVVL